MNRYTNPNTKLTQLKEQEMILTKLDELPPDDLIDKVKTEEQLLEFVESNIYCNILHAELKAYFCGQQSQLNELTEKEKEFYRIQRDYYLAMYSLFRDGWEEIIYYTEVLSNNITRALREVTKKKKLDDTHTKLSDHYPFRSPGELLSAIIENDVRIDIIPCLQGRYDMNFRKLNRLVKEYKRKEKEGKSPEELQKINEKVKKIFGKETNELLNLKNFCIGACGYAAMVKKNKMLIKAYKSYLTAKEEKETLLLRKFRNTPTRCWEKGQRRHYTQKGGTLIPPA
jgi:hypothetical protein